MQERYITTDRAIELLRRRTVKRFEKAKSEIKLAKFDELNTITVVTELYRKLDKDFNDTMLELAFAIYEEAVEELENSEKVKKDLGEISTKAKKELVESVLNNPDTVTKYTYTNEALRKRDRLSEALRARSDSNTEWRRAMSQWHNMTAQYADIVTDRAHTKAQKDADVEYVMWITQQDEKVCADCQPLDGKIFHIDKAPSKKHWHCRCYLAPVWDIEESEITDIG